MYDQAIDFVLYFSGSQPSAGHGPAIIYFGSCNLKRGVQAK